MATGHGRHPGADRLGDRRGQVGRQTPVIGQRELEHPITEVAHVVHHAQPVVVQRDEARELLPGVARHPRHPGAARAVGRALGVQHRSHVLHDVRRDARREQHLTVTLGAHPGAVVAHVGEFVGVVKEAAQLCVLIAAGHDEPDAGVRIRSRTRANLGRS